MKRIVLAAAFCLLAASASAQTRMIIQNGTTPVATGNPFPVTCISGCSGGSGGAVTIADGADVTQGAIADAASTAGGTGTVNAHLRFLTSVAFATSTNQTSQITQETAINTVLGLQADAACATDNGVCTNIALLKRSNQQRTSILAAIGTPMQQTGGTVGLVAGSAIVGNFRIDQTTPGTTNGVVVNSSALPTGAATSANQTTELGNQTAVQGPVPAGAATATKFNLGGCEYRATPPTLSDTNQAPCQMGPRGGTVVIGGIGTTPTDRTITSATGASQTVMSANGVRRTLTIVNTGSSNCGINPTGGTAAIGGAGTLTLFPGGSYTPRIPTLAAVTVICTAAQPLYADEG